MRNIESTLSLLVNGHPPVEPLFLWRERVWSLRDLGAENPDLPTVIDFDLSEAQGVQVKYAVLITEGTFSVSNNLFHLFPIGTNVLNLNLIFLEDKTGLRDIFRMAVLSPKQEKMEEGVLISKFECDQLGVLASLHDLQAFEAFLRFEPFIGWYRRQRAIGDILTEGLAQSSSFLLPQTAAQWKPLISDIIKESMETHTSTLSQLPIDAFGRVSRLYWVPCNDPYLLSVTGKEPVPCSCIERKTKPIVRGEDD